MAMLLSTWLIFTFAVSANFCLPVNIIPANTYLSYLTSEDSHLSRFLHQKLISEINIASSRFRSSQLSTTKANGQILLYISLLLLGSSGDTEVNPGPQSVADETTNVSTVYLCGACKEQVTWDHKAVMCESCDMHLVP